MNTPFRNLLALLPAIAFTTPAFADAPRPNIIFILTDDTGYGDIGVLHQNQRLADALPAFHTPNLDTMAAEGAILTQHYCPAPVCAPSRASLLLGVHQGHAQVRNNQFDKVLEDNHTLGTVLQTAGYSTAAIGKWGLQGGPEKAGDPNSPSFPTKRGFDFFFGYLDHSAGHRHYPKEDPVDGNDPDGASTVWENNTNVTSQLDLCYSTDLFTARAKQWIADHHDASPSQPFFLYLSYTAPHAALQVPTQAYPSGSGLNGGLQWTGTPGAMINTASGTRDSWIHPDYATQPGWSNANRRHATMMRRLDDAVGDLLALLDDLDLGDNTLVVFTSDNGPHNEGSWTGVVQDPRFFRSYADMDGIKRDTWEAGIRVPTLVRWPAAIPAGRTSTHPSQFHDWMPTFTEMVGLPGPARSDGVSLLPALTGIGDQRESTVYVEYTTSGSTPSYADFEPDHRGASWNQQQVIHLGGYKGIRHNTTNHSVAFKIYDVATDPKETTNLAGQPGVPTQQEFQDAVLRVRRPEPTAPRPYDNEPVPALPFTADRPGVVWKAYELDLPWVPDFHGITPAATGETDVPDVAIRTRDEDIGLEFSGYLITPTPGDYTFHLVADTGAFLRIHQMQIIDADFGYPGDEEVSATVKLTAGLHPFTLGYRRNTGGSPSLDLAWTGPGIPKQPVPDAAFAASAIPAEPPVEPPPPVHTYWQWPLDEGTGTTTTEVRTGTTSGNFGTSIAWSTDVPGPGSQASISFGAASGIATNLDSAATGISGSGAKTISAWIKTDTTAERAIFGYSPTNGLTAGRDLRLLVNAAGQLRFEANVGNFAISSATVNNNEWRFVAIVVPENTTTAGVSFYIDGSLAGPGSSGGSATINTASGNQIRIGTDGSAGRHFSGLVDHLRIHDRALSLAELDALRDATLNPPTASSYSTWIYGFFPGETDTNIIGFDADPDNDSVSNGLEWILGGNPIDGKSGSLVTTNATAAGGLTLTFTREPDTIGETTLNVEYNTDLGPDWQSAAIGSTSSSEANGVEIEIDTSVNPHEISVNIPAAPNAPGGKLFARLSAEQILTIDN